ncbi:hypothetical protein, partial [Streptomyces sp. NPDC056049]|uniref:hypothetical protein n=1 Tax=Streptomyces sp. NPDC056049 TaxID=3345693 RepID=UPI0035DA2CD6
TSQLTRRRAMTGWGAVIVAGFCGAALFLVEIAPRLPGRRPADAGTAPPSPTGQHAQDDQKGA